MGDMKRSGRANKHKFCGAKPKQKKQDSGAHELSSPNNATQREISTNATTSSTDELVTEVQEGFIMIDTSVLCDFISRIAKTCHQCGNEVCCKVDVKSKQGFAHRLDCDTCEETLHDMFTSRKTEDARASKYDVNIRMVAFIRRLGKGHEALKQFSTYLNSPHPMKKKSYQKLLEYHHAANRNVAIDSMKSASVNVKERVGGDCTVSVDGTWQKRGHVSHHGVVTAISTNTGKCLDTEVLSNICHGCIRWEKENKQSDSYLKWKAYHKCAANHGGTASSMESVGAARMFMRSEFQHDLRYVNYLGDGDSSSFKSVKDCKPYGDDCLITKMECKGKIDTLQNYFGLAIRKNVGDIIAMQNSLMASLYHVSSTDDKPNHHMCPSDDNSWCGYNRNKETFRHLHRGIG